MTLIAPLNDFSGTPASFEYLRLQMKGATFDRNPKDSKQAERRFLQEVLAKHWGRSRARAL